MFGLVQRLFGRKSEPHDEVFGGVTRVSDMKREARPSVPTVKRDERRSASSSSSTSSRSRDDDDFVTSPAFVASIYAATPSSAHSSSSHSHGHSNSGHHDSGSYGGHSSSHDSGGSSSSSYDSGSSYSGDSGF